MAQIDYKNVLADFMADIKAKNYSDEEIFKAYPEFNNDKAMLDAAYQYANTVREKKYDERTLQSKFPEFFSTPATDTRNTSETETQQKNPRVKDFPAPTTDEEYQESLRRQEEAHNIAMGIQPQPQQQSGLTDEDRRSLAMQNDAHRMAMNAESVKQNAGVLQQPIELPKEQTYMDKSMQNAMDYRRTDPHAIAERTIKDADELVSKLESEEAKAAQAAQAAQAPKSDSFFGSIGSNNPYPQGVGMNRDPYIRAARTLLLQAENRMKDEKKGEYNLGDYSKSTIRHLLESQEGIASFGLSNLAQAILLRGVFNKVNSEGAIDNPESVLNEKELALYNAYTSTLAAELARANDTSAAASAGKVTADMIQFMEEMALQSGLWSGLNATLQKTLARKLTEKLVTKASGKAAHALAKTGAGLIMNAAERGALAGETAVSSLLLPRTYANVLSNQINVADTDKGLSYDGYKMRIGDLEEKTDADAFLTAWRDQWKEMYTETGGLLRFGSNIVFKNPLARKAYNAFQKTTIGNILDAFGNKTFAKVAKGVAWDGTFNEWTEEVEGAGWDYLFGDKKAFSNFFSKEQQLPMLISFSLPAIFGVGINAAYEGYFKRKYDNAIAGLRTTLESNGYQGSDIDDMIAGIKSNLYVTKVEDIPNTIRQMAGTILGDDAVKARNRFVSRYEELAEKKNLSDLERQEMDALGKFLQNDKTQMLIDCLSQLAGSEVALAQTNPSYEREQNIAIEQARAAERENAAQQQAEQPTAEVAEQPEERPIDIATAEATQAVSDVAFRNGGELADDTPIFRVQMGDKQGYIVSGEETPVVAQGADGKQAFNTSGQVTVKWDDKSVTQQSLKDLTLVEQSLAADRIAAETEARLNENTAARVAEGEQPILMQDGQGNVQGFFQTDDNNVVQDEEGNNFTLDELNEQGWQAVVGTDENGQSILAPITDLQQVVAEEEAAPAEETTEEQQPIELPSPQAEQIEQAPVAPNIDTMDAEQLGVSMVGFMGDKADAVTFLEAERDKADDEVKRLARLKVTRWRDMYDFRDQQQQIKEARRKAVEKYNKLQNAILAANNYKTPEEIAAEEERKAKAEARKAARRQTQVTEVTSSTPADKWNAANKVVGNAVTRTLPDGTIIKGHYVLAEAGAATASHDPFNNWNTSEGFPVTEEGRNINDRDYKNDKDAQQTTMQIAQTYDGQAVEQVPVVSSEGIVYDGNGRTIAGNIAAANNTDAAYIQALATNAQNFGFSPEQVASMQHPRVLLQTDEDMPYSTTTFAKFNAQEKKSMSSTNRAISHSKKLTEAARDKMLEIIDNYGNLDTFFNSEKGASDIIRTLLDTNVISQQEVAGLTEQTERGFVLSPTGRDAITDMLIGAVFTEDTIRMLGNDRGLKQSILRAMPSIIDNRRLGDYALTDNIAQAIQLLYEARQQKLTYQQYILQGNAFDGFVKDRFSPFDMLLAEEMSSGVDAFRNVLDLYNNSAREEANGQMSIIEPRTTEDIKNEIIKRYEKESGLSIQLKEEEVGEPQTEPVAESAPADTEQVAAEQPSEPEQEEQPAEEVTEPDKIVPERPNSKQLQGMSYNVAEAEDYIGRVARNILDENGYEDVEIVGTKVIGSRVNGNAREDSDLDAVIEFKGNAREDSLFNLFEEQGIELDGVKVDINPITEGKSGTIEQFMRRSDEYLAEKAAKEAAEEQRRRLQTIILRDRGVDYADVFKPKDVFEKPQSEDTSFGSKNTIVTKEEAQNLISELKGLLQETQNLGVINDPEANAEREAKIIQVGSRLAMYYIEGGARKMTDFCRKMVETFGDAIRPYLQTLYLAAKYHPSMRVYKDEMDSNDYVDSFDVDNFDASKGTNSQENSEKNAKSGENILPNEKKVVSLSENQKEYKTADGLSVVVDKTDFRTYITPEAKQVFAKLAVDENKNFAYPSLAFIQRAAWDGVNIPIDILKELPEVKEAEERLASKGSEPLKITLEQEEMYANKLIDNEHGSAVLNENGKIIKHDGVEDFSGEVAHERKAFIIIGRPAGGKSSVYANPISGKNKARIIDADIVKPWLDGFDDGYGAGYVQEASSDVMERALWKAVENGDNIVIPKIGGASIIEKMVLPLKRAGYTVELYFNEVAPESSYMRAMARFAEEGRYLSLGYLQSIKDKPLKTFRNYADLTLEEYEYNKQNGLIDESSAEPNATLSQLLVRQGGAETTVQDERGGQTELPIMAEQGQGQLESNEGGTEVSGWLFDYAEWKNNDVRVGEKPKLIWSSKHAEVKPIEQPKIEEVKGDIDAFHKFNTLKEQYPNHILLFRVGDFYEMYDQDAVEGAKILSITEAKSSKLGKRLPMAGFPFHALDTYLPKLVRAGKGVAIVDDLDDESNKEKRVKRPVTELIDKAQEESPLYNTDKYGEETTEQESADSNAIEVEAETAIAEAETIGQPESSAESAERDGGREVSEGVAGESGNVETTETQDERDEYADKAQAAIDKIDETLDKVNDQLAVLGYYEADTEDESNFHESYGYMKTAEKKAVVNIDKLAKQLADDLGIKLPSKRKTLASANIAPAGGDISFRLPLEDGKELYMSVELRPNSYHYYGDGDLSDLAVPSLYWRVEDPSEGGMSRYKTGNMSHRSAFDSKILSLTYNDLLNEIRYYAKDYLPKVEVGTTKKEVAKTETEKAKRKKADKNRIQDGQQVLDLFSGVVDDMNNAANAVEEPVVEVKPNNTTNNGSTEVRNDGQRETSSAKTEPAGQPTNENGTLGGSQQPTDEGSDIGGVGSRSEQHRVHDGERSGGTSVQSPTSDVEELPESEWKNTNNFHARSGEELAPKSNKARFEANMAAIRLLKQLQDEGRQATREEKDILAQFSGWGGLGEFFKGEPGTTYYATNGEKSPYQQIAEVLTDEELRAAQLSRNSAYYTPASVIEALWKVVKQLGFKGGNILEGSAGIGNIIALMPSDISHRSNIQAVEIDDITAGILAQLYPDAKTHHAGFQEVDIPNNSVDLAITNVPFVTGLRVFDKKEKDLSKRFGNIHDFCIAKNVRKLRQGGIGVFITSSGTLDNSKDLRVWLNGEGQADVIGAFRLNRDTFGGTNATSDIIVIRKRINGLKDIRAIDVLDSKVARTALQEQDEVWDRKQYVKPDPTEHKLAYNQHFVEHPEDMGGNMAFGFEHGETWRETSSGCYPDATIDQNERLNNWISKVGKYNAATFLDDLRNLVNPTPEYEQYEGVVPYGSLIVNSKGEICRAYHGEAIPLEGINQNKVKGHSKVEVLNDYNSLKKALEETLAAQSKDISDDELKPYLKNLNAAYDGFVKKYGRLNKNTSLSFLGNDVQWASIAALENVKETLDANGKPKIEVSKTDVFSKRVIGVQPEPKADNAKDGVILSVQQYGLIRPDKIAEWLNKSQEEVEKEIVENKLGFKDPQTGNLQVSHVYLTGNVREKLAYAEEHNENGEYDTNIEELRKVLPTDIPSHLIEFNLGSTWFPAELYQEYMKEKFDVGSLKLSHVGSSWVSNESSGKYGKWSLQNEKNRAEGVYSELLGKQVYGHELMLAAMNNVPIVVSEVRKYSDGTKETINDKQATAACSDKISQMKDDFVDWARGKMQQDEELAERIQKIYNDRFNAVAPMMGVDKMFLSPHLPNQNPKYKLYEHQQQAVVRATMQPLMLAHEVGTGKTITLISTAMEMRRLGTAKKPMIVVQNATTAQFVKEAKDLYPNAKILTVSERDRTKEGRQEFYAKIKYNDWDLIIVPQSVFNAIPDSEARMRDFIKEKIDEKEHAIEAAKEAGLDAKIIKQMENDLEGLYGDLATNNISGKKSSKKGEDGKNAEKIRENAKARAEEMLDRKTDEVEDFDEMGIDALLIDEAHNYKHLGFATMMTRGVKGIDPSYSKRAAALFLKCQSIYDRKGHRNVVFATGTPISNTAAEIWTFMKYLMPKEVLQDNDIYYFDDFVHNFGKINEQLEFTTSGKFKANNRFAQYGNVPELMRLWLTCADCVLTREVEQVNDKVPEIEGGKAQDIYLAQSPTLIEIMNKVRETLDEFEHMSGKEKKEYSYIPLKCYGIAKRAAIDPRLVMEANDEPLSKTNRAVEETLRSLEETKKYNGTVAIFCDNYQNKATGFNIFNDIKRKLAAKGVPENQIAVIRSEMTDNAKQKIFDAVREGDIRVIMGSTQTLGTGVNIQTRLHTLIHMDAPDRPMDYTQRNGRIVRQGNMHKQWNIPVRILRFGVEDSLDVTSYQRLKTKAGFIDSIMNGKNLIDNNLENRVIEDIEEGIFDNPVAMLSGSQFALLKSQAERDLRKWKSRKEQHNIDQILIDKRLKSNVINTKKEENNIKVYNHRLQVLEDKVPNGKVTEYNVDGHIARTPEQLKEAIKETNKSIQEQADALRKGYSYGGDIKSLTIPVSFNGIQFNIEMRLVKKTTWKDGANIISVDKTVTYGSDVLSLSDIPSKSVALDGIIDHIEQRILSGDSSRDNIAAAQDHIERMAKEDELMRQREGKPFEHQAELDKAQALVDEYTEKMKVEMEEKEAKYAGYKTESNIDIETYDSDENEDLDIQETLSDEFDDESEYIPPREEGETRLEYDTRIRDYRAYKHYRKYQDMFEKTNDPKERKEIMRDFLELIIGNNGNWGVVMTDEDIRSFVRDVMHYSNFHADDLVKFVHKSGSKAITIDGKYIMVIGTDAKTLHGVAAAYAHEAQHIHNRTDIALMESVINASTPEELAHYLQEIYNGNDYYGKEARKKSPAVGFMNLADEFIAHCIQLCYLTPVGEDYMDALRGRGITNEKLLNIISHEFERQLKEHPNFAYLRNRRHAGTQSNRRVGEGSGTTSTTAKGEAGGRPARFATRSARDLGYNPEEIDVLRYDAIIFAEERKRYNPTRLSDNEQLALDEIRRVATDIYNKFQYDGELESIRDVSEYAEENMPRNEVTNPLFDAIDKYRIEEEEDRLYYGERGDLEPFEDAILQEVERLMNISGENGMFISSTLMDEQLPDENLTRREIVTRSLVQHAKDNYDIMQQAMRRINADIKALQSAAQMQVDVDRNTFTALFHLCNTLLHSGGIWSRYMPNTITAIGTQIRNAIGRKDITPQFNKIMEYVTDAQLQVAKDEWKKLLSTKTSKLNISGVVAQGKVAIQGQYAIDALNEALDSQITPEQLNEEISKLYDLIDNAPDESQKMQYNGRMIGYEIALQHNERMNDLKQERVQLQNELNACRANKVLKPQARKEQENAITQALLENTLNQAEAYTQSVRDLGGYISEQHSIAKDFIDRVNQRREQIRGYASKDLEGVSSSQHRLHTKQGIARNIWDAISSPIRDMQSLLRMVGLHAVDGEGYLYNHFMRGWTDAADKEFAGLEKAQQTLDNKVNELTNGRFKTWLDVAKYIKDNSHKKLSVNMIDGGSYKETAIDAGNALYIYAVNKMSDGRMKLAGMGITIQDVDRLANEVRDMFGQEILDIVDWVQSDYFVNLRNRYNPTHEALFGAPMDAIDNYFPLRINSGSLGRNVDLGDEEADASKLLSGTSTGAIKRRTRNSKPLDVLNADFFTETLRHVAQMERWNAFAQWTRDANMLFSDIDFRNRVKNMDTIYGKGDNLYDYMKSAFKVANGTFRAEGSSANKALSNVVLNLAKGVTSAKINFRVWTALKQIASFPAFFTYMTDANFVKSYLRNIATWHGTMKWAKENLPNFEKRLKKRDLGDMALMRRAGDWQKTKKMIEFSQKYGMAANVFFDTLTCATGARAVYDSRLASYLEKGYNKSEAEDRARQDAEHAFNTSQQSSEGAYMSPIQADRNILTAALTVFRTSPIQYTRNFVFHSRNLVKKFGEKETMVKFRMQQYIEDGIDAEKARKAAEEDFSKAVRADIIGVVVYGALLNILWRLVGQVPYLLFGDDDDKKKELIKKAVTGGAIISPFTGLLGGANIESALDGNGSISGILAPELPLTQDIKRAEKYIENDKYAEFASQALSVLVQSGTGFDPQTAADMIWRVVTTMDSQQDLSTAEEATRITQAVLSIPESQYKQTLIDAVIDNREEYFDALKDYQRYRAIHTAPLTWYMRSDEDAKKVDEASKREFDKLIKERRELKK